ncbi:MAG: ribonuclease P protein component [Patescibacteria group bacterium]
MTPGRARLCRAADFAAVFAKGRTAVDPALVLRWLPGGELRTGFCVGKQLGTAVRRNRIKRLLRESWRRLAPRAENPADLVFVARCGGVQFSLDEWTAVMEKLLVRAGIVPRRESGENA